MSHKWERVFFVLRVILDPQSQRDYQNEFSTVISYCIAVYYWIWYCVSSTFKQKYQFIFIISDMQMFLSLKA